MKPPLIILAGPTAVGKTRLSIRLARRINGEIISADSMQAYRHMDIGTAKIKPEEMEGIRHYLIDELDPAEEFNVFRFQQYARRYMEEIYKKGKIPLLVGGTGFYIQAVLYDIAFEENEECSQCRRELELEAGTPEGQRALYEKLKSIDPAAAEKIHANNKKRILRALEFYARTGRKISEHNEEERKRESPYAFRYFVLNENRPFLYQCIDKRVDAMMEQGLVEEVSMLKQRGYSKDLVSMQGLGYKEILAYLDGECSLEEALSSIKRGTRHFAKRQLTWFRREKNVTWIDKDAYGQEEALILEAMLEHVSSTLRSASGRA